jgi:hypothetical protein
MERRVLNLVFRVQVFPGNPNSKHACRTCGRVPPTSPRRRQHALRANTNTTHSRNRHAVSKTRRHAGCFGRSPDTPGAGRRRGALLPKPSERRGASGSKAHVAREGLPLRTATNRRRGGLKRNSESGLFQSIPAFSALQTRQDARRLIGTRRRECWAWEGITTCLHVYTHRQIRRHVGRDGSLTESATIDRMTTERKRIKKTQKKHVVQSTCLRRHLEYVAVVGVATSMPFRITAASFPWDQPFDVSTHPDQPVDRYSRQTTLPKWQVVRHE